MYVIWQEVETTLLRLGFWGASWPGEGEVEEGGGGGGSWYPISSDPRYYKSIKATLLNFSDKIELEWLVFHISDHNTVIMTS